MVTDEHSFSGSPRGEEEEKKKKKKATPSTDRPPPPPLELWSIIRRPRNATELRENLGLAENKLQQRRNKAEGEKVGDGRRMLSTPSHSAPACTTDRPYVKSQYNFTLSGKERGVNQKGWKEPIISSLVRSLPNGQWTRAEVFQEVTLSGSLPLSHRAYNGKSDTNFILDANHTLVSSAEQIHILQSELRDTETRTFSNRPKRTQLTKAFQGFQGELHADLIPWFRIALHFSSLLLEAVLQSALPESVPIRPILVD
ncbi:hypothetical protein AXG93_399s1110 [Marchantia polymorpha subsp. ruderalis]|uniref:Uncharacterized protein n=1 Tax=Marchantia polymorpha subsp. ruderalis TaxID=1480154 RepID=A0A176WJS3_MARPO|nr:hypothetical protein AXG93_399s1110 [Marchantia polymorpha subsp. ruderalis]